MEGLSKALTESKPSAEKFNELCESVALLRIDFVKIVEKCTEKSGVCEFLDIWLVIKNAVAAEKEIGTVGCPRNSWKVQGSWW